jgi:2-hydroxyacyl-CoA lyase 1
MGKGLLPDTHPLCISAARSAALARTDVVLVVGARLNWILHYGHQPKWAHNVKFIRIEIEHEAVDDNVKAAVGLVGDARAVMEQLNSELARRGHSDGLDIARNSDSQDSDIKLGNADHAAWYQSLLAKCHDNSQKMIQKSVIFPKIPSLKPYDPPKPLQYHQAFALIKRYIPEDHIFIGEGANTLDIARSMFDVYQPRSRLDPGTQATMGVGMGLTIAAGVLAQQEVESGQRRSRRKVVAIVGDSAFGFSAMEVETAVRNRLGMLIIVMNNGGVSKIGRVAFEAYTFIDRSTKVFRRNNMPRCP